jgi:hypothetical protein
VTEAAGRVAEHLADIVEAELQVLLLERRAQDVPITGQRIALPQVALVRRLVVMSRRFFRFRLLLFG